MLKCRDFLAFFYATRKNFRKGHSSSSLNRMIKISEKIPPDQAHPNFLYVIFFAFVFSAIFV